MRSSLLKKYGVTFLDDDDDDDDDNDDDDINDDDLTKNPRIQEFKEVYTFVLRLVL